jgi:hypothetical protein
MPRSVFPNYLHYAAFCDLPNLRQPQLAKHRWNPHRVAGRNCEEKLVVVAAVQRQLPGGFHSNPAQQRKFARIKRRANATRSA